MEKEEFLAIWKSRHSIHSRLCKDENCIDHPKKRPSELFLEQNNSGKGAESSEPDGLNPSNFLGSDSPPEKKQYRCGNCGKQFSGGYYEHSKVCSKSNPFPIDTYLLNKKDLGK